MNNSTQKRAFAAPPSTESHNDAASSVQHEDLSQLPALRNRVRRHVDTVIRCMPPQQTQAYLEAMHRDPELVYTETDPLPFVRFCNYDIWGGAKRLCLYWRERKRLFGPERAFLPLTLTGTGALTQEDLLTLRAGVPALLPDAITGHKCILFDRSKRISNVTLENRLRIYFYLNKVLSEDDLSQVDGVYCFFVSVTPRSKNNFFVNDFRAIATMATQIFPLRYKAHLLSIPHKKNRSLATEILNAHEQLIRRYLGSVMGMKVHVQTEPNQIRDALLALGMRMKGIPTLYGGDWRFEDFFDWCEDRMQRENGQYKGRLLQEDPVIGWKRIMNSNIGNPSVVAAATAVSSTGAKNNKGSAQDSEEKERTTKKRMVGLLYSRRKRERQRIEWESLQEESTQLTSENQRLLTEQARLEGLVTEAEECVSKLIGQGFP